jgi:hypothetical protein
MCTLRRRRDLSSAQRRVSTGRQSSNFMSSGRHLAAKTSLSVKRKPILGRGGVIAVLAHGPNNAQGRTNSGHIPLYWQLNVCLTC